MGLSSSIDRIAKTSARLEPVVVREEQGACVCAIGAEFPPDRIGER